MSQLPRPVSKVLREPVDEASIQRMWRGVSARRAGRATTRRPLWAASAFAVAMVALALVWLVPRDAAPLRLATDAEIGELSVASSEVASESVVLSDGSRLTLAPGATLTPLENSGTRFAALLVGGHLGVEVVPGGPRHWIFECGLATVEVVGTRFSLDRTPTRVRVEVTEGVVLVRGERVPDRVRRLVAGEWLEVTAAAGTQAAIEPAPAEEPPLPPAAANSAPEEAVPPAAATAAPGRPAGSWRELARQGAYKDAYRSLGDRGIAQEATASNVDDLLALADVARLSGHPAEAVAPLRRVLDEHSGDGRAAVAAFTLARLQLDSLGQAAGAAQSFARALQLGLPGPLVEDARARLVEAHARAGNQEAARSAAEQYQTQYPAGRHAAAVRRWVGD